jgi:hypothetical protein
VLEIAAGLSFLIGLSHSILGERYILVRLFRRDDLPKLLGSDFFTKRTLRFAWHLTTIAWWGFAIILIALSNELTDLKTSILYIISAVFFVSGLMSAGFTRLKHLSWIVFFLIAGFCTYVATFG